MQTIEADETPEYRTDLMNELRTIWDRIVEQIEAIDAR